MRYYKFGLNVGAPEADAHSLAERGFSAVVCSPDARSIRAATDAGMRAYACFGAFSLHEGDQECADVDGNPRVWFASGCPNDPIAGRRRANQLRSLAETGGLSSILIDGARFASPASQEGVESMFTCFCPACCAKMREWGVNPEQMRIEVSKFRSGERAMPPEEWLAFRAQSVREALDAFRKIVKGVRSDLMFGAFVFPHSLGALVGQTDEALESLDIIAPMLYRRYRQPHGPATLNHEYAALVSAIGKARTARLTGIEPPENVLEAGFPPEIIESETRKARLPDKTLAPILQYDDPELPKSIQAAIRGGADAVGFFG